MSDKPIDEFSGVETTGHEWDGITELNYPLPRWWLWTFYATIVFSVGYMVWYPAIPLLDDATPGISGTTNRGNLLEEIAAADAIHQQTLVRIASTDLETIRADDALARFARAGGASLYKVHCSQCHGSGAAGSPGYPNLNDDDWLWGGDLEAIYLSIKHGIRSADDDDTRLSDMPAFGVDELLTSEEVGQLADFVLTLSSQPQGTAEGAADGVLYADNCAGCHGEDGRGERELGAPNLVDAVTLYGGTREEIIAQIHQPKHGAMPAWQDRLTDEQVKQLAVYVHGLGGGEAARAGTDE